MFPSQTMLYVHLSVKLNRVVDGLLIKYHASAFFSRKSSHSSFLSVLYLSNFEMSLSKLRDCGFLCILYI